MQLPRSLIKKSFLICDFAKYISKENIAGLNRPTIKPIIFSPITNNITLHQSNKQIYDLPLKVSETYFKHVPIHGIPTPAARGAWPKCRTCRQKRKYLRRGKNF